MGGRSRPQGAQPLAKLDVPAAAAGWFVVFAAALVVLLLAATALANVVVNPRGEFPSEAYVPLTEDRARDKLQLYQHLPEAPARVVLGSSRMMVMDPDHAPGTGPAFNFAIAGAQLEDHRLVWDYLVRTQGAPGVVVLGVDPYSLREPTGAYQGKIRGSPSQDEFTGQPPALGAVAGRLPGSFSAPYLRDTAKVLWMTHVAGYPEPLEQLAADGQVTAVTWERARATGAWDLQASLEAHWNRTVAQLYDPTDPGWHVDPGQVRLLQQLLADMAAHGTQVYAMLPPWHPWTLERLGGSPLFTEFQRAALSAMVAACGPGVHVFDFTRPEAFGGTSADFIDGFHPAPPNAARFAAAARVLEGDLCAPAPSGGIAVGVAGSGGAPPAGEVSQEPVAEAAPPTPPGR